MKMPVKRFCLTGRDFSVQFCPFPPDPFALGRAPPLLFLFPLAVCLQTSAADIQHRRHDMFAGAGIVFMGKTVTLMAD